MLHKVAVLAMHGFVPFDLGIPFEVFRRVSFADGSPAYDVRVCGEATAVRCAAYSIRAPETLRQLAQADTVIIPGIEDVSRPAPRNVLKSIKDAWERGARIASICSGAFVLAQTGLLDGRRATTHWMGTDELARRFPDITVDPEVLFVDEGRIITSAGAAAGLDMCFHLVRKDHGNAIAAHAARLAVAPLDRDGGQAQFIRHQPPDSNATLAPLLDWMKRNLHHRLDVETLAARARVSPRTLARRFQEQTGTTPHQWLIRARILFAQELLETTSSSIEEVAAACGFEAPVTFRTRFHRVVGVNPTTYRQRFNAGRRPVRTVP